MNNPSNVETIVTYHEMFKLQHLCNPSQINTQVHKSETWLLFMLQNISVCSNYNDLQLCDNKWLYSVRIYSHIVMNWWLDNSLIHFKVQLLYNLTILDANPEIRIWKGPPKTCNCSEPFNTICDPVMLCGVWNTLKTTNGIQVSQILKSFLRGQVPHRQLITCHKNFMDDAIFCQKSSTAQTILILKDASSIQTKIQSSSKPFTKC